MHQKHGIKSLFVESTWIRWYLCIFQTIFVWPWIVAKVLLKYSDQIQLNLLFSKFNRMTLKQNNFFNFQIKKCLKEMQLEVKSASQQPKHGDEEVEHHDVRDECIHGEEDWNDPLVGRTVFLLPVALVDIVQFVAVNGTLFGGAGGIAVKTLLRRLGQEVTFHLAFFPWVWLQWIKLITYYFVFNYRNFIQQNRLHTNIKATNQTKIK